jgi:hypothetical protein
MNVPTKQRGTRHAGAASGRRRSARVDGNPVAPFASILFPGGDRPEPARPHASAGVFTDLHLDDIVASVTSGRAEYELEPFLRQRVDDLATIEYRHEVFHDLEDSAILDAIRLFARRMQLIRAHLVRAGKSRYPYERSRWILAAASSYVEAAAALGRDLAIAKPRSLGLRALGDLLGDYLVSASFVQLASEAEQLTSDLTALRYLLRFDGDRVAVRRYDGEPDYGSEVLATFEKFRLHEGKTYAFEVSIRPELNHVEAAVLDRVALLFPGEFGALDVFATRHQEFIDPVVGRFDREIQFYVAWLELMRRPSLQGLRFTYPTVTADRYGVTARDAFDLALATRLADSDQAIVVNDVTLDGPERALVVSGPNQGGKTTFARMFGQLLHLAALGVPVPGSEARLPLVDGIFTHFERQETVEDLSSKLEGDLRRVREILELATTRSLVVMNESFSSTTLHDQLFINSEVVGALLDRGCLFVAVTFLDELSVLDPSIVSMVSTVDPDEPARRTFRIVRRPADGLAYAMAIAEKHGLTYEQVRTRLRS